MGGEGASGKEGLGVRKGAGGRQERAWSRGVPPQQTLSCNPLPSDSDWLESVLTFDFGT